MIDLLYLAYNRLEFTRKSFETMIRNTDWSLVSRLVIYDDGSTDGTKEYLRQLPFIIPEGLEWRVRLTQGLGPIGVMCDFLSRLGEGAEIFAKIDNDVMLPPGWLNESLAVMEREPQVDLLGIECRLGCSSGPPPRSVYDADFIGGIGLMRRRAFSTLPRPREAGSRFGFTEWQREHIEVHKAWLQPAMPVCLLNLVPFDPWLSLSRKYIAQGWQRDWPSAYPPERTDLWQWWKPVASAQ